MYNTSITLRAGASKEKSPIAAAVENAIFYVDFRNSVTPLIGNGYGFYRPAGRTILDHEGLIKVLPEYEVPMEGQRRVYNLIPDCSADGMISTWTFSGGGGQTLQKIDEETVRCAWPGSKSIKDFKLPIVNNIDASFYDSDAVVRIDVKMVSSVGIPTVQIHRLDSPNADTTIDVEQDKWKTFSINTSILSSAAFVGVKITGGATDSITLDIRRPQLESVTAQDNINPSEYVSVGLPTGQELVDTLYDYNITETSGGSVTTIDGGYRYSVSGNETGIENYISIDKSVYGYEYDLDYNLYMMEVDIENYSASGTAGLQLRVYAGYSGASTLQNITTNGTLKFTVRVSNIDGENFDFFWLNIAGSNTSGDTTFDITRWSIKKLDHGFGVDGVKYFPYSNGNTVSSNVVNEARGKFFQPIINKGVSTWENRTNLVYDSEDFESGVWNNLNLAASTGSTEIAGLPAKTVIGTVTDAAHLVRQYPSVFGNNTGHHSASAFFAKGDKQYAYIQLTGLDASFNPTGGTVHIDLDTGALTPQEASAGGTVLHSHAKKVKGGWRLELGVDVTDVTNDMLIGFGFSDSTSDNTYAGDGSTVNGYVTGMMHNAAQDFPAPYIPTTTTTASTATDVIRYNQDNYIEEGTILVEFEMPRVGTLDTEFILHIFEEANKRIAIGVLSDGSFWVFAGDAALNHIDFTGGPTIVKDNKYKIAVSLSATVGQSGVTINGTNYALVTDNGVSPISPTHFNIGSSTSQVQANCYLYQVQIISEVWTQAQREEWSKY